MAFLIRCYEVGQVQSILDALARLPKGQCASLDWLIFSEHASRPDHHFRLRFEALLAQRQISQQAR